MGPGLSKRSSYRWRRRAFSTCWRFSPPGWGGNLLRGLFNSVQIAVGAFGIGLLIGTGGAYGKLYGGPVVRDLLEVYTTIVRAVPELVLILLLYFAGTDLINRVLEAARLRPHRHQRSRRRHRRARPSCRAPTPRR